jgi:polyisoprenoid-binding protein YceI
MRLIFFLFYFFISFCLTTTVSRAQSNGIFKTKKATVSFHSEAPKELITATSRNLKGLVDFNKGTFIFKIKMNTFEGFNNELQREHFNENYIESNLYPEATFTGKIIETIDINKSQIIKVRSKGKFSLHGLSKEYTITVTLKIEAQKIDISSEFFISLQDFNIKIPKVVYNKLASKISVSLNAQLEAL